MTGDWLLFKLMHFLIEIIILLASDLCMLTESKNICVLNYSKHNKNIKHIWSITLGSIKENVDPTMQQEFLPIFFEHLYLISSTGLESLHSFSFWILQNQWIPLKWEQTGVIYAALLFTKPLLLASAET